VHRDAEVGLRSHMHATTQAVCARACARARTCALCTLVRSCTTGCLALARAYPGVRTRSCIPGLCDTSASASTAEAGRRLRTVHIDVLAGDETDTGHCSE
jgi:hypothetical protein